MSAIESIKAILRSDYESMLFSRRSGNTLSNTRAEAAGGIDDKCGLTSKKDYLDLSPFLTQTVKTQNPFKGELSHGDIA
jgi:hypothetical protein